MSDKRLTLCVSLTKAELESLLDAVTGYEDMGPRDEGWKSPEAESMVARISEAVDRLPRKLCNHGDASA